MTTNAEMYQKCIEVEETIRKMVLMGITEDYKLVYEVSKIHNPTTDWEMEMYSEIIIDTKRAVLN
jgi:hypothetical protein